MDRIGSEARTAMFMFVMEQNIRRSVAKYDSTRKFPCSEYRATNERFYR